MYFMTSFYKMTPIYGSDCSGLTTQPSDMTMIVIVDSLIILQPHNTQSTTEPLYTR